MVGPQRNKRNYRICDWVVWFKVLIYFLRCLGSECVIEIHFRGVYEHAHLQPFRNNAYPLKEILSFATKKLMTICPKWLIIDCNNRILFQILCVKSCSHILVEHLISIYDDVITRRLMSFFHYKFTSICIHDWWQNDMDIQNIIWKCD